MEVFTESARETAELGKSFADSLKTRVILALTGDLGSGKTTFVQGLALGLGITQRITSPTFILLREYDMKRKGESGKGQRLYHVDLYRLEGNLEPEVKNLGLEDIWDKEENIVVIEWAEKIAPFLPKTTKFIKFERLSEGRRKITFV
ncbi:MAG: tRNA (adenosine(37)-N6)-threonylcarbamoyltransferase complex ATPase subunit type 1 TsaE [bacterium]|nr:tRNA (adenosine(37)-N6)-threonylcarbamoyltransferase complex ATPase subunit type 1 TsaE [bacterium]